MCQSKKDGMRWFKRPGYKTFYLQVTKSNPAQMNGKCDKLMAIWSICGRFLDMPSVERSKFYIPQLRTGWHPYLYSRHSRKATDLSVIETKIFFIPSGCPSRSRLLGNTVHGEICPVFILLTDDFVSYVIRPAAFTNTIAFRNRKDLGLQRQYSYRIISHPLGFAYGYYGPWCTVSASQILSKHPKSKCSILNYITGIWPYHS